MFLRPEFAFKTFLIGALVSGAALGTPAATAGPVGSAPTASAPRAAPDDLAPTLRAVAAWITAEFGLPAPRSLPSVVFLHADDLVGGATASGSVAAAADPLVEGDGARAAAAYDPRTGEIRLPLGWTGTTVAEMSLLVHEMVHHVQTEMGMRFACVGEREQLAYAAQARWLEAYGGSLRRDFGINPMFLLIATNCGM